ncbi:MAG: 3-methyl-2-oxobutanoate dehydrogenase subunit VorB [Halanaerobiaceae bacterium]
MGEKTLIKGNEAIAEAAVRAGCRYFFGYPITPQNEIPAYMSWRLPEVGGDFVQAESEVAASNMVYGAAGAGARVMTSSSSPGISLKAEGISYIAGAELPCLIVNMMRGGPGLGGINPSQSDYFQATKGMAHGNFHLLVMAPSSVQEAVDLTSEAFDLADKYRNPVMILGDGMIGQMMEPVEFPEPIDVDELPEKKWATTGAKGRERNIINSLYLDDDVLEDLNWRLKAKYDRMQEEDVKYETYNIEDAEIILIAYGTTARITLSALEMARQNNIKVGMIRPITLFPFPKKIIFETAEKAEKVLTLELSTGQMVEDVKLAVKGKAPVQFQGWPGGNLPTPEDIYQEIVKMKEMEV